MRIRTQFTITMLLFGVVMAAISASAIITNRQVEKASNQEKIASNIAQGASNLSYLANDYLIYRERQQLSRWNAQFASFSNDVAGLHGNTSEQQALVRNVQANAQRMKEVFDGIVSTVENSSQNQNTALEPMSFQVSWSRMAVQSQGLVSDASRLSNLFRAEVDRAKQVNILVTWVMIGVFGAYFLVNYLAIQRRALEGLAKLQAGTAVIGSGNLEFRMAEEKDDEIGDLSRAINRMTADLKSVTASKEDLEREIAERKRAEMEREHLLEQVQAMNEELQVQSEEIQSQYEELRANNEALTEAQRTLAEWEQRYYLLFEQLAEGFAVHEIICDERGQPCDYRFLDVNPAFERQTGLTRDVVGKSARDVLPGLEPHWIDTYGAVALTGQPVHFENYAQPLDKHYEVFAFSPRRGEFATLFLDVTERKRAEAERERLLAEVQRHAAELAAANKELEAFTYTVAHDLRSPVRHMGGFSKVLMERYTDKLDERGKQYLEFVREGSDKMSQLIDDLLSLASVTRSEVHRTKVDLSGLAQAVATELQRDQPERLVDFVLGPSLEAEADQRLVRVVLANLLGNAWKFTAKRERARIEFNTVKQGGKAVYYVRDNGAGFDMAYAHKLFGAFQRLHSEEEYPGTGIGLATIERIIRRHGGRVWAEGETDKGAAFYFTLS